MSMYASFGSDAVALRDVFVSRLRSLTEVTILLGNLQGFLPSFQPSILPSILLSFHLIIRGYSVLVILFLQDVKLKIAILEFIATAVETQPGLIELFLNLKEKDKNSQVMNSVS